MDSSVGFWARRNAACHTQTLCYDILFMLHLSRWFPPSCNCNHDYFQMGLFLKAHHHWSPPGAWAPSEDAQEIQVSNLQPHLLNKKYHCLNERSGQGLIIHLEELVCTSSPWVGQGLQSISLYDAPSAAWLFRSSLLSVILLKVSDIFFK